MAEHSQVGAQRRQLMEHARCGVGGAVVHADDLELVRGEPLIVNAVDALGDEPLAVVDRDDDGKQWVCHEAVRLR